MGYASFYPAEQSARADGSGEKPRHVFAKTPQRFRKKLYL
jgi:hypothetical protein